MQKFTPQQALVNAMTELSCTIKDFMRVYKEINLNSNDRYIAIPQDGGDFSLEPGVTEFNFFLGRIKLPSGEVRSMSTSLQSLGFEACQSIRIDVNGQCKFWLNGSQDKRAINATARLAYQEFTAVYLETTVPTTVRLWASTAPEALINDSTSVVVNVPGSPVQAVRTRPGGALRAFNTEPVATSGSWKELTSLVVPKGRKFQLCYIAGGSEFDIMLRVKWGGEVVSPVFFSSGTNTTQLYFPYDYLAVEGDGEKAVVLEVQGYSNFGTAHGEIVGEAE